MQTRSAFIDLSLWLGMFTKPRKTIRRIIRSNSNDQVMFLAPLFGIYFVLSQLSSQKAGDLLPFPYILMIVALGGPVIGMVLVYLTGVLLHWTGGKLGGQAQVMHLRAAYAFSFLPNLIALLLWLPKLLIFGNLFFKTDTSKFEPSLLLALIFLVLLFVPVMTNIWSFILLLVCISEVQRFSLLRAFFSLLWSLLILVVPVYFVLVMLQAFGLISYFH